MKGKHNNNSHISPFHYCYIYIYITAHFQRVYKEKKTTLTPNGHFYKNKWKGSNAGNTTGTKEKVGWGGEVEVEDDNSDEVKK